MTNELVNNIINFLNFFISLFKIPTLIITLLHCCKIESFRLKSLHKNIILASSTIILLLFFSYTIIPYSSFDIFSAEVSTLVPQYFFVFIPSSFIYSLLLPNSNNCKICFIDNFKSILRVFFPPICSMAFLYNGIHYSTYHNILLLVSFVVMILAIAIEFMCFYPKYNNLKIIKLIKRLKKVELTHAIYKAAPIGRAVAVKKVNSKEDEQKSARANFDKKK